MSICDEKIFKEVFSRWQSPLQHFILSRADSKDVYDIVQECFLKLWRNCKNVRSETVSNYLFTSAKNMLIDNHRKHSTKLKYQRSLQQSVEMEDGQFAMEVEEFKIKLEQAMDTMPETAREVFVLHRFEGLSYKSIAESLGIGQKAIEKRMHKALAHLIKEKINIKR